MNPNLPVIGLVLAVIGLTIVSDAIYSRSSTG